MFQFVFKALTEEDEKAFEMFMSSNIERKSCVAESLKEKLTSKQTEIGSRLSGDVTVSTLKMYCKFNLFVIT